MLACILEHLKYVGEWPRDKTIKITYVLNDTSGICLGTGQRMLTEYFRTSRRYNRDVIRSQTISIRSTFPDNMNQLRRIRLNLGAYDIATFSYVISPLNEDKGFDGLVNGLLNTEKLCNHNGRILILQDKFQAALVRRISGATGTSSNKQVLTQYVYPKRNDNETYAYTYYRCLYAPVRKMIAKQGCVV